MNRPASSTRTSASIAAVGAPMAIARRRSATTPVDNAASTASTGMCAARVASSRWRIRGQIRSNCRRRCRSTAWPTTEATFPSGSRPTPSASDQAGGASLNAARASTLR